MMEMLCVEMSTSRLSHQCVPLVQSGVVWCRLSAVARPIFEPTIHVPRLPDPIDGGGVAHSAQGGPPLSTGHISRHQRVDLRGESQQRTCSSSIHQSFDHSGSGHRSTNKIVGYARADLLGTCGICLQDTQSRHAKSNTSCSLHFGVEIVQLRHTEKHSDGRLGSPELWFESCWRW